MRDSRKHIRCCPVEAMSRLEEEFILKSKDFDTMKHDMEIKLQDICDLRSEPDYMAALDDETIKETEALTSWREEAELTMKNKLVEVLALETQRDRLQSDLEKIQNDLNLSHYSDEKLENEVEELCSKVIELETTEKDLVAQLSSLNEETIILARSSLEMATAFKEKIKHLQPGADCAAVLESDLKCQRTKYHHTQLAMAGLKKALLTVEKERVKLARRSQYQK